MHDNGNNKSKQAGQMIADARGEMPLREFAHLAGVSHQTVSNWEHGLTKPQSGPLVLLALGGNVSMAALARRLIRLLYPALARRMRLRNGGNGGRVRQDRERSNEA